MVLAVDNVTSWDQVLAFGAFSRTFSPIATPQGIMVMAATYENPLTNVLTGITYGGQALTLIGTYISMEDSRFPGSVTGIGQAWYLPLNTLSGPQTIAIQQSTAPASNSWSVMAVSYTTSSATRPIALDGYASATGTGFSSSVSHTISNHSHLTVLSIEPTMTSPTQTSPTAPTVSVLEDDWGIRFSNFGQITGISNPGTYTQGFTYTISPGWIILSVAIKEGLPGPVPVFEFQGNKVQVPELPYQITRQTILRAAGAADG